MKKKVFTFRSRQDGLSIVTYNWMPDIPRYKGVVVISHGMVEHSRRYQRFAKYLTDLGYVVYSPDQRGHGKTAGSVEKVGYLSDQDGFEYLVKDIHQVVEIAREEHKNLKVFLLGHSMGSFIAQRYIQLFPDSLDGVILSGSNGANPACKIGKMVASNEIKKNGKHAPSKVMNDLAFGSYNKAFKPARTDFDWLSRDTKEVDKYVADPYCGVICSGQFYYDFMNGLIDIYKKENTTLVSKDIPIYIVSGGNDPVGNNGKGIKKLEKMYRDLGIRDVEVKLYKDARHEILNETNRIEVMKDIYDWMERH